MALHTLTEDGLMGWRCGDCGTENSAHYTHPGVHVYQPPDALKSRRTVRLPACPTCGATVHLKVDFSEKELAAPNMVYPDGTPTASYHVAQRHMQLASLLEAAAQASPATAQEKVAS